MICYNRIEDESRKSEKEEQNCFKLALRKKITFILNSDKHHKNTATSGLHAISIDVLVY